MNSTPLATHPMNAALHPMPDPRQGCATWRFHRQDDARISDVASGRRSSTMLPKRASEKTPSDNSRLPGGIWAILLDPQMTALLVPCFGFFFSRRFIFKVAPLADRRKTLSVRGTISTKVNAAEHDTAYAFFLPTCSSCFVQRRIAIGPIKWSCHGF